MANDLYNHLVIGNTATYQPRDMTKKKKPMMPTLLWKHSRTTKSPFSHVGNHKWTTYLLHVIVTSYRLKGKN